MKPSRGKRVGSVQSAWRIQHGGFQAGRPVLGGSPSAGTAARRGARPPQGAFPPRRCAATGSGSAGKALGRQVARGFAAPSVTAASAAVFAVSAGLREIDRRRALPRPSPSDPALRGRDPVGRRRLPVGGRGPPPPTRLSTGADCPQCAPTASRRRAGRAHVSGARGLRRCR